MASDRFATARTALEGLQVVTRRKMGDHRGFLMRMYCADDLADLGFDEPIAQINCTVTVRQGAVRGMHFQYPPTSEAKFVSVLNGKVLDVAVDIRQDSPTFLQWHSEILSADNCRSLYIPEGFAHGFQALTPDCMLLYLHSAPYVADREGGLNPLDDRLAIDWPLPITDMSERDRQHPLLSDTFTGIVP